MTLVEAKQKAAKIQYLVNKNTYKPSDKNLTEIIVAPANRIAFNGFINEKFKSVISNDDLLKLCTFNDFKVYGIFDSQTPYDIYPFENIADANQKHPDFAGIDALEY